MNIKNSEHFSELFSPVDGESIKLWEEAAYTWFTIFKEYKSPFVETNEWKNDLYCLIRLWFRNWDSSEDKLLNFDVSIQSRYLQKNHFLLSWNEKDETFPKKESIEKFSKSHIPFWIHSSEKSKAYYNTKTKTILFNKKELSLRQFIDEIFWIHVKSASLWNNIRYHYSSLLISYIFKYFTYYFWYKIIHRLIIWWWKINDEEYFEYFLFNWTKIKMEEDSKDSLFNSNKKEIEKFKENKNSVEVQLPLFGWKLHMNKNWLFWWIFTLWCFAILYFCKKCWDYWIIKLFEFYKDNEVISWVLIIVWLFIFSFIFSQILPGISLYIMNAIISLRKWILNRFYYEWLNYDSWNNPYK